MSHKKYATLSWAEYYRSTFTVRVKMANEEKNVFCIKRGLKTTLGSADSLSAQWYSSKNFCLAEKVRYVIDMVEPCAQFRISALDIQTITIWVYK